MKSRRAKQQQVCAHVRKRTASDARTTEFGTQEKLDVRPVLQRLGQIGTLGLGLEGPEL